MWRLQAWQPHGTPAAYSNATGLTGTLRGCGLLIATVAWCNLFLVARRETHNARLLCITHAVGAADLPRSSPNIFRRDAWCCPTQPYKRLAAMSRPVRRCTRRNESRHFCAQCQAVIRLRRCAGWDSICSPTRPQWTADHRVRLRAALDTQPLRFLGLSTDRIRSSVDRTATESHDIRTIGHRRPEHRRLLAPQSEPAVRVTRGSGHRWQSCVLPTLRQPPHV